MFDIVFKVEDDFITIDSQEQRMYKCMIINQDYNVQSHSCPAVNTETNTLYLRGGWKTLDNQKFIRYKDDFYDSKIEVFIRCLYKLLENDYTVGIKINDNIRDIKSQNFRGLIIDDIIHLNPRMLFIKMLGQKFNCRL